MIYGRMSNGQRELIMIGLAQANLDEMKKGKPMLIGPVPEDPLMANTMIILMTGEAEKDMLEVLKKLKLVDPNVSATDLL